MYWVPLWWFVKSTLRCPTPFSFVYCYVINHWGRWLWLSMDVLCVYSGPWPFNLFIPVVSSLFDWVGVLWPQLSASFPPRVLAEAGCLSVRPVFMCSDQGRAYTVSWLVQIESYSNLWLVTLHSCFQPASFSPHTAPLHFKNIFTVPCVCWLGGGGGGGESAHFCQCVYMRICKRFVRVAFAKYFLFFLLFSFSFFFFLFLFFFFSFLRK